MTFRCGIPSYGRLPGLASAGSRFAENVHVRSQELVANVG